MTGRYSVLRKELRVETEVERSRFVATLASAASAETAQARITAVRREFPDAGHHCYAFVVGPAGSTRNVGFSDDGEPHNTAGRPIFDVLVHSGVGDVLCVVSRWFGGVKLGRGGLVRAYGGAAQAALASAELTENIEWRSFRLRLPYAHLAGVQRFVQELDGEVLEEEFAALVSLSVQVPVERSLQFEKGLNNLSRGGEGSGIDWDRADEAE